MHVGVADDLAELLKVDFAVFVLIGKEDCLVDDLLQLSVFQIGTHHHFQHLEELTVADVPVVINIVDSEKELKIFVKSLLTFQISLQFDNFLTKKCLF